VAQQSTRSAHSCRFRDAGVSSENRYQYDHDGEEDGAGMSNGRGGGDEERDDEGERGSGRRQEGLPVPERLHPAAR